MGTAKTNDKTKASLFDRLGGAAAIDAVVEAFYEAVLAMLKELNSELGQTLILITHNPEVAAHSDRILHMRDGCTLDSAVHPAHPKHTHELIIPE